MPQTPTTLFVRRASTAPNLAALPLSVQDELFSFYHILRRCFLWVWIGRNGTTPPRWATGLERQRAGGQIRVPHPLRPTQQACSGEEFTLNPMAQLVSF